MDSSDNFLGNAKKPLIVESSDITNHNGNSAMFADMAALAGKLLAKFRPSILIGTVLIASGLFHLALLWVTGADWSGPLSLRKPGLFGVSAGVTVWSIAWVLTQFEPRRYDQRVASFLSGGLLLEVGLITIQQWRGVSSHFNRATALDATIESMMLGLILLVTAGIAWLCWRSRHLQPMFESRAIAIRAGHNRRRSEPLERPATRSLGESGSPEVPTWCGFARNSGPTTAIGAAAKVSSVALRCAVTSGRGGSCSISRSRLVANIPRTHADGTRRDEFRRVGSRGVVAPVAHRRHRVGRGCHGSGVFDCRAIALKSSRPRCHHQLFSERPSPDARAVPPPQPQLIRRRVWTVRDGSTRTNSVIGTSGVQWLRGCSWTTFKVTTANLRTDRESSDVSDNSR